MQSHTITCCPVHTPCICAVLHPVHGFTKAKSHYYISSKEQFGRRFSCSWMRCGTVITQKSIWTNVHWNGLLSFFIACMKFWTKRSANQQVLGWYCVLDFIQFDESFEFFRYKLRTIIRQICFGSPNLAKMYLNAFTVLDAVVEFI